MILPVTADRTVQTLQVTVDDENQVVQTSRAGQRDGRLVIQVHPFRRRRRNTHTLRPLVLPGRGIPSISGNGLGKSP